MLDGADFDAYMDNLTPKQRRLALAADANPTAYEVPIQIPFRSPLLATTAYEVYAPPNYPPPRGSALQRAATARSRHAYPGTIFRPLRLAICHPLLWSLHKVWPAKYAANNNP